MHPIATLLSTLLLSTTLTSALPAADPPRNVATQPQHTSTTTITDPISPPGAHVRRQKVVQPYVPIAPDRKKGWKRTPGPEMELAARQVKWLPPSYGYLPVPDKKAVKARDVNVNVDEDTDSVSGFEKRQKVAQPWVLVAPDRKKGWKRSEEPTEPEKNDGIPDVVARQVNVLPPVRGWPASDKKGFKVRDVEAGEEVGDVKTKRDKGSYVAEGPHKPWVSTGREQVYW
jgi:hypothetical protein